MRTRHHLLLALTLAPALTCATLATFGAAAPVTFKIDLAANPEDKALMPVPVPADALARLSAQLEIPTEQNTGAPPAPAGPVLGLCIKPRWGQYGVGSILLPRTFPPGRYTVKATLVAPEDDSARVALYAVLDNKKQIRISSARGIPAGAHANINVEIYAPAPFDRIALKKMDTSPKASIILATLSITDLEKNKNPFLAAYHQVLRHPAPWGLTNPALANRLATHLANPPASSVSSVSSAPSAEPADSAIADADALQATAERWLDQRSHAAELASQADDLARVIRILRLDTLAESLHQLAAATAAHREALAAATALDDDNTATQTTRSALAARISALQQETARLANGNTRPETSGNLATWIKNWNNTGQGEGREFNEPTPWRAAFPDKSVIRFLPPPSTAAASVTAAATSASSTAAPASAASAIPVHFESTWTTNLYDTGVHRFYYNILTPLTVVETRAGRIEAETTGFFRGRRDPAAGWFTLRSDDGQLLFIASRPLKNEEHNTNHLTVEFSGQDQDHAALGYVRLPRDPAAPLETIARFYRKLLACQPLQCVQIQRGPEVELAYEYRLRPAATPPVDTTLPPPADAIAPLPHLLRTWLKTPAGHEALAPSGLRSTELETAPDGWSYAAARHTLRHTLPRTLPRTLPATRAATARHGINIWLNRATRENYDELAAQGCQLIRLVLRDESKWDWSKADETKTLLQRNFDWIRETGAGQMKVYPALFESWAPDALHHATGFRPPLPPSSPSPSPAPP
ncbi:MAG: hypothetical protein LBK99_13915, partial [Opitutaceae bacterium]|nr:hypothetical protein [Opitutaceae bacterium]